MIESVILMLIAVPEMTDAKPMMRIILKTVDPREEGERIAGNRMNVGMIAFE
jgi:hypothetical protein